MPTRKKAAVKKKAPAKKSPARTKKAAPKKVAAKKKAPARKATPARKAPVKKKAPAKKAPAKKAPAKKAAPTKKKAAPAKKAAAPAKKPAPAKAPAVKKVVPRRSATLDKFQEGQKAALLEERDTYTRQATALRQEADELARDRDPGDVQFDEEGSGQGDTMNVERERDLALSAQAMAAVDEIDRALEKLDLGTYGICERCGQAIPKERLRAIPWAALCVQCKSGGLSRR